MADQQTDVVRATGYITRPELWALDEACKPIAEVFGPPYMVGSVTERPTFRDVDVRLILADEDYDALPDKAWSLFGFVTSRHLAAITGLPIDFQVQRRTEANAAYPGKVRNPLGVRLIGQDWGGDQRPGCQRCVWDCDEETGCTAPLHAEDTEVEGCAECGEPTVPNKTRCPAHFTPRTYPPAQTDSKETDRG